MIYAAKVMALAGLELATDPAQLKAARDEFAAATKDNPYKCPVPAGIEPPLDQLAKH